jgi:hypothetical protein
MFQISLLLSDIMRQCGEDVDVDALERLAGGDDMFGVVLSLEDEVGAVLRDGDVIRASPSFRI